MQGKHDQGPGGAKFYLHRINIRRSLCGEAS